MSERALSSAFIASTFTCKQYSISALLLKRQYSDKAVYMVNEKEYFTTIPIYMDTPVSVTTKSYSSAMEKLTSFPNCSNVPPVLNPRCYPSASFANCWLVCLQRIRLTICCKKARGPVSQGIKILMELFHTCEAPHIGIIAAYPTCPNRKTLHSEQG